MKKNVTRLLTLLIFVQLVSTGCTSFQSVPIAALKGSTVMLAIGSPDGMNKTNTSAVFVSQSDPGFPDTPVEYPLDIRAIVNLYGDKASSQYNLNSSASQITQTSGHEPWLTVAAIDLPTSLPEGPGEVRFISSANYPTIGSHINEIPIELEILPAAAGTGSASTFPYEFGKGLSRLGDLSEVEPEPRAVIEPIFQGTPGPWPSYGAIELDINMPNSATTLRDRDLRVLADDMTATSNSKRSFTFSLSNNQDLKLILLSPPGRLRYYEARFTIIPPPGITFTSTPTITSVSYYDINGNEVAGPLIADYISEER